MATVRISKIKVRRGSNDQRKFIVFDQGELVYTVDTKRLFVGTGTLSGGGVIGSKIHPLVNNYYSLSNVNAEIGDLVNVNNKYYQLTAANYSNINSWADVSTKLNTNIFTYDSSNKLNLIIGSVSASYIQPNTVSNGIQILNNVLQSNFNTKSLEISATQLSLKSGGIDEREINSSTLGLGLTGGSGYKIQLNSDPQYFYYANNTLSLTLSNLPQNSVSFYDLSASWWGQGLVYNSGFQQIYAILSNVADSSITKNLTGGISVNPALFGSGLTYDLSAIKLSATLTGVDNNSIVRDLSGQISINNNAISGTNQWGRMSIDSFGRVVYNDSSIYGTLTGNSSLSSLNITNSLSSIFNGSPSQSLSGEIPGMKLARFTATDINGFTVTLSSAGFITFEGNTTTRNGSTVGRFAIPIFAY